MGKRQEKTQRREAEKKSNIDVKKWQVNDCV